MGRNKSFLKTVCAIAIPVTLQSMLQSSFSIVDQIMIGQLGEVSVAGVGYAGKFSSIYSVIISAIGAVAGIMLSQYLGQKNRAQVRRSFSTNLWIGMAIAGVFTAVSLLLPRKIMGLYTRDMDTVQAAAEYLHCIGSMFFPLAVATMLSTFLRCTDKPRLPLYASLVSALLNTGLNYILIFGKLGFEPMGARGAAIATAISQYANCGLMLAMMPKRGSELAKSDDSAARFHWMQYLAVLSPILLSEIAWSLGENVYTVIYGHMGTDAGAAMTLINPIQGLVTGSLCGLSQAAAVIIGKRLGSGEFDDAYASAKKLIVFGGVGAIVLSVTVVLTAPLYVEIYQIDQLVKTMTRQILVAYALVAPFKVLNMILGGGILRSGGRTKYVMFIDMIGTWCFGIPLGLLAAFVLELPIASVYFLLSLEECFRLAVSLAVLRRRNWMQQLN